MNATAALVALFGRVYDPTSLGALSLIKYTAFMAAILVGVLMVFITVRHTRSDEESGRLELLGGGRLGRDAPLAAALAIAGVPAWSSGWSRRWLWPPAGFRPPGRSRSDWAGPPPAWPSAPWPGSPPS